MAAYLLTGEPEYLLTIPVPVETEQEFQILFPVPAKPEPKVEFGWNCGRNSTVNFVKK